MAWWIAVLLMLLVVGGAQGESPHVAVLDFKSEDGGHGKDDWTVGLADFVELALQKESVASLT